MKKVHTIQCTSNEGTFYYEPTLKIGTTKEEVQESINSNAGKVTGFRYTDVKVLHIHQRNYSMGHRI